MTIEEQIKIMNDASIESREEHITREEWYRFLSEDDSNKLYEAKGEEKDQILKENLEFAARLNSHVLHCEECFRKQKAMRNVKSICETMDQIEDLLLFGQDLMDREAFGSYEEEEAYLKKQIKDDHLEFISAARKLTATDIKEILGIYKDIGNDRYYDMALDLFTDMRNKDKDKGTESLLRGIFGEEGLEKLRAKKAKEKGQEGEVTSEDIAGADKDAELTQTDFENADRVITEIKDKSKDEK